MSVELREMDDVLNVIANNVEIRYLKAENTPGFLYRNDVEPWRKDIPLETASKVGGMTAFVINLRKQFSNLPEVDIAAYTATIAFLAGYFRLFTSNEILSPGALVAHFITEFDAGEDQQLMDLSPEARVMIYQALLDRINGKGSLYLSGPETAGSWALVLGHEFRKYVDDTDVIGKMGEQ